MQFEPQSLMEVGNRADWHYISGIVLVVVLVFVWTVICDRRKKVKPHPELYVGLVMALTAALLFFCIVLEAFLYRLHEY